MYTEPFDWSHHRNVLEGAGVVFQAGLTAEEVARIEGRFGFRFPPDYRDFLMLALPVSQPFVDWRNGDEATIRATLALPYEGICFDIEADAFWPRTPEAAKSANSGT